MITVIGNLKGGTGKSTVSFNLSLWVATHRNVHVIVYDLDPQATLCDAFEIRLEDGYAPAITPKNTISGLEREDNHSEIIIDIGMSDIKSMKKALLIADRIVIPIGPSQADVWSTQRFLTLIDDTCKGNNTPKVLGFMNRADTHFAVRETDEAYEALLTLSDKIEMLESRLYQRTAYRRSFSEGMAVFELDKKSKASLEVEKLGKELY